MRDCAVVFADAEPDADNWLKDDDEARLRVLFDSYRSLMEGDIR